MVSSQMFLAQVAKRILSRCLLNEGRLSILLRCPLSSHRLTPRFSFCLEREGTEMSRCHFPSPHPFNMEQNLGDASLIGVFHSPLVSLISHNQPCFGLLISLESLFFFSPLRFLQPRSLGFRETRPAVDLNLASLISDPVESKPWCVTAI